MTFRHVAAFVLVGCYLMLAPRTSDCFALEPSSQSSASQEFVATEDTAVKRFARRWVSIAASRMFAALLLVSRTDCYRLVLGRDVAGAADAVESVLARSD